MFVNRLSANDKFFCVKGTTDHNKFKSNDLRNKNIFKILKRKMSLIAHIFPKFET